MCRLPGFATWPCDELNSLWRIGNGGYPNDAIPAERLRPQIRNRIRAAFRRQSRMSGCSVLVEKTCANCLRVDFVAQCFPEAMFVQIVRHPIDTIPSTLRRVSAPLDIGYLAKKARYVPVRHLPMAVVRSIRRRFVGPGQSAWGPVVPQQALPPDMTCDMKIFSMMRPDVLHYLQKGWASRSNTITSCQRPVRFAITLLSNVRYWILPRFARS
jgi:hypothetical protein